MARKRNKLKKESHVSEFVDLEEKQVDSSLPCGNQPKAPHPMKVDKTQEERRKEIKARVTAARIAQLKLDLQNTRQDDSDCIFYEPSSQTQRRTSNQRKLAELRKIVDTACKSAAVREYWERMSTEKKRNLVEVTFRDLRTHYALAKNRSALDILSEAQSFMERSRSWKCWKCFRCSEEFVDLESLKQHVWVHIGNLSQKAQTLLPKEVDSHWVEMLLNDSWKPLNLDAVMRILDNHTGEQSFTTVGSSDVGVCTATRNMDNFSDDWGSKDALGVHAVDGKSEVVVSNGCPTESRKRSGIANFSLEGEDNEQWPSCDDPERAKLLEKIHVMFQLLLKCCCLTDNVLQKVINITMNDLKALAPSLELLDHGLDKTTACICLLGATQLQNLLGFLEEILHSCQLSKDPEKTTLENVLEDATALFDDFVDDISLSDDSSHIIFHKLLSTTGIVSKTENTRMGDVVTASPLSQNEGLYKDDFVSRLYGSSSTGEELKIWTRVKVNSMTRGMEIFEKLEKEFNHLKSLLEQKLKNLCYTNALISIENLCNEESNKRDPSVEYVTRSYEAFLRKRQGELQKLKDHQVEVDAIMLVLKEAQSLNVTQFGKPGITSCLSDLESCNMDSRLQDNLHVDDRSIALGIDIQKKKHSHEINILNSRIRQSIFYQQHLEHILTKLSFVYYQYPMLHLVRMFLRAHLEDLVKKDAVKKSDDAREALLAELKLEEKNKIKKGLNNSEHIQEKKKKNNNRKARDLKGVGSDKEILTQQEVAEQAQVSLSDT